MYIVFLLLGCLAAVSAVPIQKTWELVPTIEGRFTLVHVDPFNLEPEEPEFLFVPETDVIFRLFTRSNPTEPQFLELGNSGSISGSNFNPANPTRFTIHGWNSNGEDGLNTRTRDELLAIGDYNMISVDWSAANSANYLTSRNHVQAAGRGVSLLIAELVNLGASENDMYLIGFSLGAHVAANAGKFTGGRINTIFGLDPAGPFFGPDREDSLHASDAQYVEQIGTNGGVLGINLPLGGASFFPNGGRSQPGCGTDLAGSCAHGRAPAFYVESLRSSVPFRSIRCLNHDQILQGNCQDQGSSANMGGEPSNFGRGVEGVYFLTTNDQSPFARG
ncbi:phospholipase A1 member A-like [Uranotaenia lowii]|uniref:phospholipase A1 member A-like n=1 Tax=Uranotaenia lowii TaxID=190385 RepID=UPI002478E32A|nr:phospholipase A1 member A-like [Uranotaenia lowii]